MKRIEFKIKDISLGGSSPIVVQTMCNTNTLDVDASVAQCQRVIEKGAEMVRLTTQGLPEVKSLEKIKNKLISSGFSTPLVADVHFNSEVAFAAASVADKVRINPGNFAQVHKDAQTQFARFIEECKKNGTAVRIGLNHGSLGQRITTKYGNTPLAMKEAVCEWLAMCKELDFEKVAVSLKASNTLVMSQAYRLLYEQMVKDGVVYPLHLGVTEAGNADTGRIKSAIGIGTLLKDGIGNTIRVSLTENPENEIPAGKSISRYFEDGTHKKVSAILTSQFPQRCVTLSFKDLYSESSKPAGTEKDLWNDFITRLSLAVGTLLLEKKIDDFVLTDCPYRDEDINGLKENILQAARRKFYHPEYIACPGCGRTQYNLEETFNKVKEKTAHLKGVKIAVMGCIVNGPGEMADADYGYVGQGGGKVTIYKGKEPVYKSIAEEDAIDLLLKLIEDSSK